MPDPATDVDRAGPPDVGDRLRERRLSLDLSVRELARRLSLSPSLISQIERGKAMPSVATLYAITNELKMSVDALFSEFSEAAPAASPPSESSGFTDPLPRTMNGASADVGPDSAGPVVHPDERNVIQLASGVRWERLTRSPDPEIDFLHVVYEPGGASCDPGFLMRHAGREYGFLLAGKLEVSVGFEMHVLEPGDAISFDSTVPHRLAAVGDQPARAVWFVAGRLGDSRFS
jgi:DNA-binding XRE family transcriptional regulator/quercetin dioxygenase-like cupin family protein